MRGQEEVGRVRGGAPLMVGCCQVGGCDSVELRIRGSASRPLVVVWSCDSVPAVARLLVNASASEVAFPASLLSSDTATVVRGPGHLLRGLLGDVAAVWRACHCM